MRLAAGLTPAQAARSEGIPVAEVECLLAEPAFLELVAAYRAIEALPPAERVARLKQLAWGVLEMAMVDGDVRVALFVAAMSASGRDPGQILAEAVVREAERASKPPPPARPSPHSPLPPRRSRRPATDPLPALLTRAGAHARRLVKAELAARPTVLLTRPADRTPRPLLPTLMANPAAVPGIRRTACPRGP
jgi:hypothetical protein